jgi:4-nitrophenyl phosphatase
MRLGETVARKLSRIRAIALDLDGVVYVGGRRVTGALAGIERIRALGIEVCFVTNNSAQTRAEIAEKLAGLGIEASEEDVLSSGYAAAQMARRLARTRRAEVTVIGSAALRREVGAVRDGKSSRKTVSGRVLLVGLDRNFTYRTITKALDAILGGAVFIACNRDARYPVGRGRYLPGCGAMVAAIEAASGKRADHEIGKPNAYFLQMIAGPRKLRPDQILVVGDSEVSDIAMAKNYGSPSVLIAPEHGSRPHLRAPGPILVLKSLLEVAGALEHARARKTSR